MARDRGPFGRRSRAEDDTVSFNPVDQLDDWRTWRSESSDTVEFPAVAEDQPAAGRTEELSPVGPNARRRRFVRPGVGVLTGGGLVAAALLLSGLAAAGVGPVRHLLGTGHTPTSTSRSHDTSSGGSSGNSTAQDGTGSSGASRSAAPTTPAAPADKAGAGARQGAGSGDVPAGPAVNGPAAPSGQAGQGAPAGPDGAAGPGGAAGRAGQVGQVGQGPPAPNGP